jgi:hypothetical protein
MHATRDLTRRGQSAGPVGFHLFRWRAKNMRSTYRIDRSINVVADRRVAAVYFCRCLTLSIPHSWWNLNYSFSRLPPGFFTACVSNSDLSVIQFSLRFIVCQNAAAAIVERIETKPLSFTTLKSRAFVYGKISIWSGREVYNFCVNKQTGPME